jgi:hypothetical protein
MPTITVNSVANQPVESRNIPFFLPRWKRLGDVMVCIDHITESTTRTSWAKTALSGWKGGFVVLDT